MNKHFKQLYIATMELNPEKLNIYQKQLDDDEEVKISFVDASNNESESESESENEGCKIIFPKNKQRRNDTSQELLYQLLIQNKKHAKVQKRLYELQSELDREEVRGRYAKLELNNVQVAVDEAKEQIKTTKNILFKSQVENWVWRITMLLFLLYRLYYIGVHVSTIL